MIEQQKGLAKKLRLAWNWWLLFLPLMFALSILGYTVDGAFGIVVVCTASAIALLCGFSSPRTPKLVMRLGDSNSLIRQQPLIKFKFEVVKTDCLRYMPLVLINAR